MKERASSSSMKGSGKEKASSSSMGVRKDTIGIERDRREKMSEYYTLLQSNIPTLFPKATRARIVDETISQIKSMEAAIAELESYKKARESQAQMSSNISVTISNKTAFFTIYVVPRPGMLTRVMEIFEKHKAQVLQATVLRQDRLVDLRVLALLSEEEITERIRVDLLAL